MKKYLNFAAWTLLSLILMWMVRCAIHENKNKKPIDPTDVLIQYQKSLKPQ